MRYKWSNKKDEMTIRKRKRVEYMHEELMIILTSWHEGPYVINSDSHVEFNQKTLKYTL